MALCDYVISADIKGYDCSKPPVEGVESVGYIVNRKDIDPTINISDNFNVLFYPKTGAEMYKVVMSGKEPFHGTQQEMVEGVNANTITNTVQLIVLKQDENWAEQLFALMNGEFVAVIQNKQDNLDGGINSNYQVYGLEAGLHCTGAVRELYNDDNLSGWQITFTEEGATKGNLFADSSLLEEWDLDEE